MILDGAYDADNVFARMLRGEIPATRVCEDDATLAFMDLYPQAAGHVLVISKTSIARTILEVEDDVLTTVMRQVRRIACAIERALQPAGLQIVQANGAAAGQTVFHLHVHIIPRYDAPLTPHAAGAPANPTELARLATKIRDALR